MNETSPSPSALKAFVSQGWSDHAEDSPGVMARFPEGIALVREAAELPPLAALITHVSGEHLGQWQEGLELLQRLAGLEVCEAGGAAEQALLRSQATLHLCAGEEAAAEACLERAHPSELPADSTRLRVLAAAAGALVGQREAQQAQAHFERALELAAYGPDKEDPAARALAIVGNNLACALEEQSERSAAEDQLLELAAKTARKYWEVAGGWNQVQVAEYRLAMTYLALARPKDAAEHAALCRQICADNEAGPGDLFFAHEVEARVRHALGEAAAAGAARKLAAEALAELEGGLADYAAKTLGTLDELLG